MTPALALTSQSLDPIQAFAADEEVAAGEEDSSSELATATVEISGEDITGNATDGYVATYTGKAIPYTLEVVVNGIKVSDFKTKVVNQQLNDATLHFPGLYYISLEPSEASEVQFAPTVINFCVQPYEVGFEIGTSTIESDMLLDLDQAKKRLKSM